MQNKKIAKKIIKILILLLILILLAKLISFTLSKYESNATSNTDIQVAFYIIKEDYQSMNVNLDSLFPREEPYVYTFSISNNDGTKMCETDMEYDLTIRTTTNLPIDYELYMNEDYKDSKARSIIKTNDISQDEYNTYFRTITTDTQTFTHIQEKTNVYQLVLYFPQKYNTLNYQDIIEAIEIDVKSKQVI